jgi:hypothetical protein
MSARRAWMSQLYRVEDLSSDEIRELLASEGKNLTEFEVVALRDFIHRIGGIENAILAIDFLDDLEKAA